MSPEPQADGSLGGQHRTVGHLPSSGGPPSHGAAPRAGSTLLPGGAPAARCSPEQGLANEDMTFWLCLETIYRQGRENNKVLLLRAESRFTPNHSHEEPCGVCWVTHQSSGAPSLLGEKEKQNRPTNTTSVLDTGEPMSCTIPKAQGHRRGTGLSGWSQRPRWALQEGRGNTERIGGLDVQCRSLYPPRLWVLSDRTWAAVGPLGGG